MRIFLNNKKFRLDVILRFISDIGEYLFNVVFMIYAANVYKSELAVSIASFIAMFPLIFQLVAGILADNTKNKKKMIYIIGWIQAFLFIIAYFIIENNSLLSFAVLCLINISSDSIGLYLNSLENIFYGKIVGLDDINEASLFNSVVYRLKALIGPALGVFLLNISNNNYKFVTIINSLTFIIYAIFVKRIYSDLENPDIVENESLKVKLHEIINNVVNIFKEEDDEDSRNAIILIITNITTAALSTSANNLLTVSLVNAPIFNFSFDTIYLINNILITSVSILSGLIPNDRFSKYSLRKIFIISLISLLLKTIFFAINSDISKIIGIIIGLFAQYVTIKIGPKISQALYSKVDQSRIGSVSSALNALELSLLPVIVGLMLLIYNFNNLLAFVTISICTLINLFLILKET